jgi:lactobin A/cerein 7B family class IIb bacteriocin
MRELTVNEIEHVGGGPGPHGLVLAAAVIALQAGEFLEGFVDGYRAGLSGK